MDKLTQETSKGVRISSDLFLNVEHLLYIALGLVLSMTALIALVSASLSLWSAVIQPGADTNLLKVIDRLLFVLMLAEILHTVRVSIRSGALTCEPFLIVGLIASIRRVLVITLESSQTAGGAAPSELFQASMIELGVLCALIMVMVISIFLIRRSTADGRPLSTDID
jgi:uncharacterized membrane protein (DUF373 family)